jgi:hypothetical protein
MLCDNEKWQLCAYLLKSLNNVEQNYDIHDKEMLAIMRALSEWRHYLEGATHKVEILTDHKNLEYFMGAKKLNQRQARWSLELSHFDFVLKHHPRCSSDKPNLLPRHSDYETGVNDNDNHVLLKPDFFHLNALQEAHVLINTEEKSLLTAI